MNQSRRNWYVSTAARMNCTGNVRAKLLARTNIDKMSREITRMTQGKKGTLNEVCL